MKKFTRIASLLLALVMVLGLAATAFAEEDQQFTLTIDTHYTTQAFDVYQIFAGTVKVNEEGQREISDLTWGANVTEEGKAALLTFDGNVFADINELAEYLSDNRTTDREIGARFAAFAENYLTENYMERIVYVEDTGYQATLPGGYYLIKNPDEIDYGIFATDLMLKVVGNITIAPKTPGPKIWKAVWNNNDSTNPEEKIVKDAEGNYVGINTWDIGDTVRFMLNGTIPADVTSYDTYRYEIHDVMAEDAFSSPAYFVDGRDFEVYICSQTKSVLMDSADYTVSQKQAANGFVVKMDLAAVVAKYADQFTDGNAAKNIVVRYSVEFLGAAMGAHENTNKAWIEYLGDGKSNEVTTWTGTLQFTVHKVEQTGMDENDEPSYEPLEGAEFKLQKFMQKDDGAETVTFTYNGQTTTYTGEWVDYQNQFVTAENGTDHIVKGLDEGIYKLIETKAPEGYTAAEDLIFKVATAENYQYGALTKLAVYTEDGIENIFAKFGNRIDTPDGYIMDATRFETSIVNFQTSDGGAVLPETGGMGTTLFYVLGAVLVLGAAILLITKRRMNTEN